GLHPRGGGGDSRPGTGDRHARASGFRPLAGRLQPRSIHPRVRGARKDRCCLTPSSPETLGMGAHRKLAQSAAGFRPQLFCARNSYLCHSERGAGIPGELKEVHYRIGYFLGVAGADFAGAEGLPPSTDRLRTPARDAYTERVTDVSMKMIAAQVVALVNTVAAVRVPKAVWLPMPPKAAAMSALLPLCSRTTVMRNAQTMI